MKKITLSILTLLVVLVFSQKTDAQDRSFGIGGMLGDPYGVSFKLYIAEDKAIAAGLGFGIADEISYLYITADFLLHRLYEMGWDAGSLHLYYGPGVSYYDPGFIDATISLRGPLGLGADFRDVPVGVFLEVAPYIDLSPDFYFSFMGAAGFRFYIN